jgi:hypothetical protein
MLTSTLDVGVPCSVKRVACGLVTRHLSLVTQGTHFESAAPCDPLRSESTFLRCFVREIMLVRRFSALLVFWSRFTVFRTFVSLKETNSARARRRPLVSPILEKLQINHFVGSHCHGFTPLR